MTRVHSSALLLSYSLSLHAPSLHACALPLPLCLALSHTGTHGQLADQCLAKHCVRCSVASDSHTVHRIPLDLQARHLQGNVVCSAVFALEPLHVSRYFHRDPHRTRRRLSLSVRRRHCDVSSGELLSVPETAQDSQIGVLQIHRRICAHINDEDSHRRRPIHLPNDLLQGLYHIQMRQRWRHRSLYGRRYVRCMLRTRVARLGLHLRHFNGCVHRRHSCRARSPPCRGAAPWHTSVPTCHYGGRRNAR